MNIVFTIQKKKGNILMKKIIALALALMMVLSFAVTASADEVETGSITINVVSGDPIYSVYRLLDLESYDIASGAYSYKVNPNWAGFFATDAAQVYFTVSESSYASWNSTAGEDDDTKAAFAKLALAYAEANDIDPVKTSAIAGDFVINGNVGVFSDLPLGYYLVDSTVGALCGLTTTNPNASVNAKNGIPTIDKQVMEDSTSQWGKLDTADIGQILSFRITINVHAGAQNYVLHDQMPAGITYYTDDAHQLSVTHVIPGSGEHTTPSTKYSVVTDTPNCDCTFEVHFTEEFCNDLETNDKVIVTYYGMLRKNAVIAGDGNVNNAWLTFGTPGQNGITHKSNVDSTTTKTFSVDIVKTDSQNLLLKNAQFRIYDAQTGGSEIAVVPMEGDAGNYRRARTNETGVVIENASGLCTIFGLDNGTYYLEEVEPPAGYEKLATRTKFIISDGNLEAIFNEGVYSTGSGIHIVNKSGQMLPETGGIGTTLFVTIGAMMVMAAGVLLVTKKRMSMIQD